MESIAVGATIFVVALILLQRRMASRTVVVMMAISGAMLGGVAYALLEWVVTTLLGIATSFSQVIFGRALAALAVIALTIIVVIDIWPKRGSPRSWTPWAALMIFPAFALAIGPAIPNAVENAVASAGSTVIGMLSNVTEGR